MTTPTAENLPNVIHIEKGRVFEGTEKDDSRVLDLNAAENQQLVTAIQTEGRSSAMEWPDGTYRFETDRLYPMEK